MYGQQISRRAFLNMCGARTAAVLLGQRSNDRNPVFFTEMDYRVQ